MMKRTRRDDKPRLSRDGMEKRKSGLRPEVLDITCRCISQGLNKGSLFDHNPQRAFYGFLLFFVFDDREM